MAGTKVNTYAVGDVNLTNMMTTLDDTRKGYNAATITHMSDTTVPAIAAGSMIEINGGLYSFASEEAITVGGVADGTVYIIIDPSTITASFTATAPTWSDSKQGWYGTGGTANCRYLPYVLGKSSTYYSKSSIDFFSKIIEITSNSSLVPGYTHYINATSKIDLTLPLSGGKGEEILIIDIGGFGYQVLQNANQNIIFLNKSTIPGTVGKIWSKIPFSVIKLKCSVANLTWIVIEIKDKYIEKGFVMGGITSDEINSIVELNFETESSQLISKVMSLTKTGTGVSSSLKGYSVGGFNSVPARVNQIEGFAFATEVSASIVATLDTAKNDMASVSNNLKGYVLGGYTVAVTNVIEDLSFATEASAVIAATLDTAKSCGAGVSSSSKGYIMGGDTVGGYANSVNVIEDLNFATETSAAIAATLDTAKSHGAGVSSNSKGYILGGLNSMGAELNVIEDLNFATETSAAIAATLVNVCNDNIPVSSSLKGYSIGGAPFLTKINYLNFATETSAVISDELSETRKGGAGVQGYN